MMRSKSLLSIILTIAVAGCSPSVDSDAPENSSDGSPLTPMESVSYELPSGTDLSVLQEGEISGAPNSYLLVIGSPDKPERLAVTALPAFESNDPWPKQAAEWEEGFLQKMSRKLLSEPAELDGRQAHHIVAEVGEGDDSVKIDVYFFNVGKWNYTIALTAPSSANNDNGNLVAVRDSIHVR